jgi:hypothetical protein
VTVLVSALVPSVEFKEETPDCVARFATSVKRVEANAVPPIL